MIYFTLPPMHLPPRHLMQIRILNLNLEKEKQRSSKLQAVIDGRSGGSAASASPGPPLRSASGLDPEVTLLRASCISLAWSFKSPGLFIIFIDQAVEDVARGLVAEAAEAAEAASREAAMWKERAQLQTNKIAQTEQKVQTE